MRLLSFLTEIERALAAASLGGARGAWDTSRMLNFHYGMGRLTLRPRANPDHAAISGNIFVQTFSLADGSPCLKASLGWDGSEALPVIAIYSTPTLNWRQEAVRIANAWLKGPPEYAAARPQTNLAPLVASAG
jgi:hypothetical protein